MSGVSTGSTSQGDVSLADQGVFDICGPLPTGTTLLEASAGTGKTWTIGALVTRFVAEGVATLDEMLVVTFGRAASQELRERVRAQLVEAERALSEPGVVSTGSTTRQDGSTTRQDGSTTDSELVRFLLDADADELAARRERLRAALGAFDGATIATTHQFCHLVLRSLGVAGDTDANATLVEDLEDLLSEVVDDLYLARFGALDDPPPFTHADALKLARAAAGDPQARLEPADATRRHAARSSGSPSPRAVRDELDRRKRRLGVLSYDDLLSQLAHALADEHAPARQRMRRRWSVVLVDEFQDTDPVQWQVLDRAFTGHATMVLIGDPKQAIYAFRGGDVSTYLQAAATATTRQTLGTQLALRRRPARRGSQVLLRGAALGDDADRGPRRGRAPRRAAGWTGPVRRSGCAWSARTCSGSGSDLTVKQVRDAPLRRRRPRHQAAAHVRCDLRRRPAPAARRRRHRLPQQRPAGQVQRRARRGRGARGGRRQRQRLRHPGGHRVAAPAGGAGAAAPLRAGAQRGADPFFGHDAVALDAGGDDAHRPGRRHRPRLGRAVRVPRRRGRAGGRRDRPA